MTDGLGDVVDIDVDVLNWYLSLNGIFKKGWEESNATESTVGCPWHIAPCDYSIAPGLGSRDYKTFV
jgi:hypothetical protein